MIVALTHDGYFISQLHDPDAVQLAQPNVVEAPDADRPTTEWRLVDGQWVVPEVVDTPPGEGLVSLRHG